MLNTNQNTDASAMAFLNFARRYHEAAEELVHSKPHLTDVLYFLYFHVTELLFKAYLRAHDLPIRGTDRWGHKLSELYIECRGLGLKVSSDDRSGLENIVKLLALGNEDMGFRYFSLESGSEPDLNWAREEVGRLMQVVAAFVESKKDTAASAVAVKMIMTLGKPSPKDAT